MQEKHERIVRPNLFYVFVGFEIQPPTSYVIPSAVVAEAIGCAQKTWLQMPGHGGRPHKETKFRRLRRDYGMPVPGYPAGWVDQYWERWDLLSGAQES